MGWHWLLCSALEMETDPRIILTNQSSTACDLNTGLLAFSILVNEFVVEIYNRNSLLQMFCGKLFISISNLIIVIYNASLLLFCKQLTS